MYEVHRTNRFRKSYKKIIGSGDFFVEDFDHLILLIANREVLPIYYYDHALSGNMSGSRECHIKGDCLLVYKVNDAHKVIYLVDIGNHANLFE